jgi:isopenicillin N synthase-like dioxygenase
MTATNGVKPQIPIVDFANYRADASLEARQEIAKQVVDACRKVGFVYITNHGVPEDQLKKAFEVSKKFYDLPLEDKMKAPHPANPLHHRGYSKPGTESITKFANAVQGTNLPEVQEIKESYEVGSENNPDQTNIWPPDEVLPEWRPFMTSFYWTCYEATKNILRALALGIGLEEDYLLNLHSGHYNQLRLLHYPPVPAEAVESGQKARMPAHTDYGSITILFQDDCGGLQVEHPNHPGEFIDATPVPGALIMNVGDLLQRWSNDYLKSTKHRVTLPPLQDRIVGAERMTRARYSIPYFCTTNPEWIIECLKTDEPPKYKPVSQREYSEMRQKAAY